MCITRCGGGGGGGSEKCWLLNWFSCENVRREKKKAAAGIKERVCRKRRCGPATKNPQIYLRFGQRFVFTVWSCSPPPSPPPNLWRDRQQRDSVRIHFVSYFTVADVQAILVLHLGLAGCQH